MKIIEEKKLIQDKYHAGLIKASELSEEYVRLREKFDMKMSQRMVMINVHYNSLSE